MLLQTQERDVVWNKINDFTMYNYEKKTEKKILLILVVFKQGWQYKTPTYYSFINEKLIKSIRT